PASRWIEPRARVPGAAQPTGLMLRRRLKRVYARLRRAMAPSRSMRTSPFETRCFATLLRVRSNSEQSRSILAIKPEQAEEIGWVHEHLPRLREAGGAAELAPLGRRLGKIAGGDVMPDLFPFGRRQHLPQRLVHAPEALEKRGAILAIAAG